VSRATLSASEAAHSARELLALNLIRLRQQRGLSQDELALEAGLHRTFVAHVERQARNISLDNIERLAVALGVPVFRLLKPTTAAD
jgi:transcriptional regulator with XRE-family HTH domain